MQDLIICDEEFTKYCEDILSLDKELEAKYAAIIKQLKTACEFGYKNGVFHDNLQTFIDSLVGMQDQISCITNKLQTLTNKFIEDIDEIDVELY